MDCLGESCKTQVPYASVSTGNLYVGLWCGTLWTEPVIATAEQQSYFELKSELEKNLATEIHKVARYN